MFAHTCVVHVCGAGAAQKKRLVVQTISGIMSENDVGLASASGINTDRSVGQHRVKEKP